jgi:hypothetical protein
MALGSACREYVARHVVAVLQSALRLITQRSADVLDRFDEVQSVGEQLQVRYLRERRAGRRRHELGEI